VATAILAASTRNKTPTAAIRGGRLDNLTSMPGFVLTICACASWNLRGTSWLGSRSLVRLGMWSYALYLVHDELLLVSNKPGF